MANELANRETSDTDTARDHSETGVVQTPFCGSLRSKKFFMLDAVAADASQYLDSANHCWCSETQQVIGPDGARAHPSRCVPGRSCYTSALERL